MKTVSPDNYNHDYFVSKIGTTISRHQFEGSAIYSKMISLTPALDENDLLLDFGCGTGLLSFALRQNYSNVVIGVDYSNDAIKLADSYLNQLGLKDIRFICSNIHNLPYFNNVKCIYFSDVVEHLYDHELSELFDKIKEWRCRGAQTIVVHTDNNIYLRYVRPILDMLDVIRSIKNIKKIRERNEFEKSRHVNLMTPNQLVKKLNFHGYKLTRLEYPEFNRERLMAQIGPIAKIYGLVSIIRILYPLLSKLSPSFYAQFVYNRS